MTEKVTAPKKEQSVADLNAQIAELQAKLAEEKQARSEAEETVQALANIDQFVGNSEERPTGRTIKIRKCVNPHEKDEKKQKFIEVEEPTFYYTIQLPTGAGLDLTTNGIAYYHGQTYEFDLNTLIDIKSRVARTWDHEKSIHGNNENAYRKPTNQGFVSAQARARGAH